MRNFAKAAVAGLLFSVAACAIAPVTAAIAAPAPGDVLRSIPAIACDTFEQIESIATADDPKAAFRALAMQMSTNGSEPACIGGTFSRVEVVSVKPLDEFTVEGMRANAWAVEIRGNAAGAVFWILYVEPAEPTRESGRLSNGGFGA